jgi:hypothetical protein
MEVGWSTSNQNISFSDNHKSELRKIAQERGLALLERCKEIDLRIDELYDQLDQSGSGPMVVGQHIPVVVG